MQLPPPVTVTVTAAQWLPHRTKRRTGPASQIRRQATQWNSDDPTQYGRATCASRAVGAT